MSGGGVARVVTERVAVAATARCNLARVGAEVGRMASRIRGARPEVTSHTHFARSLGRIGGVRAGQERRNTFEGIFGGVPSANGVDGVDGVRRVATEKDDGAAATAAADFRAE